MILPDINLLIYSFRADADLLGAPNRRIVGPGPRHWDIFQTLCRKSNAKANLIQDAWFAAIAMEHGCEWITDDRGYARFPGLRWRAIHAA